jgi:nucleotide-binding universal stress UspA family protein
MMIHHRSPQQPERRPIVVGVDGSPGSKAALRWALDQAERTTATVEAVIVWAPEAGFYYGFEWASVAVAGDDLAAVADTVLMDTLVEVTGDRGRSAPIQPRVLQGRPVAELLRAAGSAQLLVLGGPAHGRIAGLVRGSVSHECLQRAACPVLIVPASPGVLAASADAEKQGRAAPHPAKGLTL